MTWYFVVDVATGAIRYRVMATTLENLAANVPDGTIVKPVVDGVDARSHRWNSESGEFEAIIVPPGPPSRILTPAQYFQLFTPDEQLAIFGSTVPELQRAVALTLAATSLDLDDPVVIGGLDQMAAANFITAERATQIKAGETP